MCFVYPPCSIAVSLSILCKSVLEFSKFIQMFFELIVVDNTHELDIVVAIFFLTDHFSARAIIVDYNSKNKFYRLSSFVFIRYRAQC